MTFVTLPSLTDVMSRTDGASAWAAPAFAEFFPAIALSIGLMAAAIIIYWIFTHLQTIGVYMQAHIHFGTPQSNPAPVDPHELKRRLIVGYEVGKTMIIHDNLSREMARLEKLYGYNHGTFDN